jgi:DNA-binding transcriptional regulator GbsR (MarR family)
MTAREEIEGKLEAMRQKLAIMEWDLGRDQLNPAMKMKYQKLKDECRHLEQEIKALPKEEKKVTKAPDVKDENLPLQGVVQ